MLPSIALVHDWLDAPGKSRSSDASTASPPPGASSQSCTSAIEGSKVAVLSTKHTGVNGVPWSPRLAWGVKRILGRGPFNGLEGAT